MSTTQTPLAPPEVALTWLYVPGDRPERFAKAIASGASVVILDLEDAVDGAHKERAREEVRTFLDGRSPDPDGPQVHVRINQSTTELGAHDLATLTGLPGLEGVRLPKVESTSGLDDVVGLVGDGIPLYALVESARGLKALDAIATHPRVAGIALGEQDLLNELAITHPGAIDQIRVSAVLAAAAAGLPPVPASIYPRHLDDDGLREGSMHARTLGMFGRSAIHPRQIPVIQQAFAPSDNEVAWAKRVVAASRATGGGAATLDDGEFIDHPIVARAEQLLALADHVRQASSPS